MRDGVSDMHCMSDLYLAEELKEEYDSKNLWLTCDKGKNGSGNLLSMRGEGEVWKLESSNARHKKMGQDIKSGPIFYSSPVGLERVRSTFHFVSVPLRSVQSQHPPDVVNRC